MLNITSREEIFEKMNAVRKILEYKRSKIHVTDWRTVEVSVYIDLQTISHKWRVICLMTAFLSGSTHEEEITYEFHRLAESNKGCLVIADIVSGSPNMKGNEAKMKSEAISLTETKLMEEMNQC